MKCNQTNLTRLIRSIKPYIADEYVQEGDTLPSIQLTIGYTDKENWSYQTGDNSFMGAAYHHRYWGVVQVYRRSNSKELADDILQQIYDQTGEF